MHAYVGVTDGEWYRFLKSRSHLDEVNFWQPGGKTTFKAIKPGDLFLFKLHYPYNRIAGGGIFAHSTRLPINLAWEAFGESNGARTLSEMRSLVGKFKKRNGNSDSDFTIGCILIEQPFFLDERDWISVPDWNPSIVQGKTFDLSVEPGLSIWKRLHVSAAEDVIREERVGYGEPVVIQPRLGQGSFRILVTDAYERRCAITNERTLPALDAAHIKPYSETGNHEVKNGILLRRDLHALFDQGYVTVNPSMQFEVSRRIKEEFENGRDYYRLHGGAVRVPARAVDHPDRQYLEWHNTNIYKG